MFYSLFQLAGLGGFILFFGFLAFNGGSQLATTNDGDGAAIATAVINTIISASFAGFVALIINRIKVFGNERWSLLITINGALTGMVRSCMRVELRL
jgi:Amt family ammonium transporter